MTSSRTAQGVLAAAAAVLAVVLGVCVLVVLAMTQPAVATPVVRTAIGAATGQETQLERAQMRLAWPPGFEMRGLQIAGDVAPTRMSAIDGRVNPLGFLPGIAFLPRVEAREGQFGAQVGGEGGGDPPGWLGEIGEVRAEAIALALARGDEAPDMLTIQSAAGNLRTGDLELTAQGGGATVTFTGGVDRPFGRGVHGDLTLQGDNIATLADLAGLAAPDTPPYELNARLETAPDTWRLAGLSGTVGDSDLAGDIEVRLTGERPFIDADLRSETLDFDDLGLLVGAPTQVEGEESNQLQRETNQAFAASDRLIPDASLDLTRVRAVDADVDYTADSVRAGGFPMEAVAIAMNLQGGVMEFETLRFEAAQGALDARATIDAAGETVTAQASGDITGVQLGALAGGAMGRGALQGRFELTTAGQNLRAAAAGADGALAMWLRDGAIRALVEEGADLDVGEALLVLAAEAPEDPVYSELRCAVARFEVEDGLARARPVVFDSEDSTVVIEGSVNLADEALDLRIDADNKDFSWGQILGGIAVEGTLRNPSISPELGEAVVQGGLAALLGAVAGPLAALPFINPDEADDAPCGALLARAQGGAATAPGADDDAPQGGAAVQAADAAPAPDPAEDSETGADAPGRSDLPVRTGGAPRPN